MNKQIYDLASKNLYLYLVLHNIKIDPNYIYHNKFFMSLYDYFNYFLEDKDERTIILEAAPRSGKTEFIVNVIIPYIIGNNPGKRMMIITYSQKTRKTIREMLERVLKSEYFKDVFKVYGKIQANESSITMPNGFTIFLTTTLSATPIGDGFHFIIATDYLASEVINSKAIMHTAMQKWEKGYVTRTKNDPRTKFIIDNQRLDYYDLSWKISEACKRTNEPLIRITFPYQFEEDTEYKLPSGLIVPFKKGEFLTERFNEREKQGILSKSSIETFKVQYQQNPLMEKGKIFNRSYFRYYNQLDLDLDFVRIFITTDFAFTQKQASDYTVLCCWAEDTDNNLFLLDMQRGKYKGIELNVVLYNFWHKWRNGIGKSFCSFISIEKIGTQNNILISQMRNGFRLENGEKVTFTGCGIREISRGNNSSKYHRAMKSLAFIQQGKVFLPSHDVIINGINNISNEIVEPFLEEHERFSENDAMQRQNHDDIVDNCLDAVSIVDRARVSYEVGVYSV